MNELSSAEIYQQYLQRRCSHLDSNEFRASFETFISPLATTDVTEPENALELNNFGVIALIEAEQTNDKALRELYVQTAIEAFNSGIELENHPLCKAHLAIIEKMLGDRNSAGQDAFEGLISTFIQLSSSSSPPLGLVYLPAKEGLGALETGEILQAVHQAPNGLSQAALVLATTLCGANLAFYTSSGLRTLHLLVHALPQGSVSKIRLGIASLSQGQVEGLQYLYQAYALNPKQISILQVLFLACLDLRNVDAANHWLMAARQLSAHTSAQGLDWQWVNQQSVGAPATYISFDGILLSVEASLRSIVTCTLLAEGDWFEDEMTLWRRQLQPGMVVIDVGANVGIYTFSAAKRVKETGKVFAIEPFSACVSRLEETRQINQFDWVKVCAGAASNHSGKARLGLSNASELNQLVTEGEDLEGQFEEVTCFTLDDLVEQEGLSRVDWLKIDAEGHEIQVLEGSTTLLKQFKPKILYENVASGINDVNLPVAEFLIQQGYILHTYQPYLDQLIPLGSTDNLRGHLNIVAIHESCPVSLE